ncbi:MAG: hypothetical protein RLY31_386 [Bacteroidota bacterium]|jgi:copper chaperone CopZ
MKAILIAMLWLPFLATAGVSPSPAGNGTETFKVLGNCGMCKQRIEKAVTVKGVKYAVWDEETKLLTVRFNPKVVTLESLHERCAAVGHDTARAKASDDVYNNLHGCCQYDRDAGF